MRVRCRWALLVTLCVCAASAQTTHPADQSPATPLGALRSLNEAMRRGDVNAIKQRFLATNSAEMRMVDAAAQMAWALSKLRAAATHAYGAQGGDMVTGEFDAGAAESAARIDGAEVSVSGDEATVTYRDEKNSPFVLRKVDGQWKVPASQLGKPLEPGELDQRLADLAIQRKIVEQITDQILQKRLSTPQEAREAWRERILQAATSQPTTRSSR